MRSDKMLLIARLVILLSLAFAAITIFFYHDTLLRAMGCRECMVDETTAFVGMFLLFQFLSYHIMMGIAKMVWRAMR